MVIAFKKDMVVVTNENREVKGLVHCVLCDIDVETDTRKKKRRKDYYSQYWNGQKWSLSNFTNHHLNKVHPRIKSDDDTASMQSTSADTTNSSDECAVTHHHDRMYTL